MVLKCSIAVIWVCRMVTAKVRFVLMPQTHVIMRCAIDDLSTIYMWLSCSFLSRAITGAASVTTFPRHVTVEYGTLASKALTTVARFQAVTGVGHRVP